jgi:hypothetical protein
MSIREAISKKKSLSIVLALAMIVMAGGVMGFGMWPQHHPTGDKACYSDDDGQTFFIDSAYKVVPFDHDGKQAVRAMVFNYDNGHKTFIVCLMRHTTKGQTRINGAIEKAGKDNLPLSSIALFDDRSLQEVKLPGAGNPWMRRTHPEAMAVMAIKSPDGSAVDMMIP